MMCPNCGYPKTSACGTTKDKGATVERTRTCHKCGVNFQTAEALVRVTSRLVNGTRVIDRKHAARGR